ncbi:MAG: glycerophosphodiester phosphodiesterase family protein [Thermoguttaceae bacterium]|nr:glycerophosphodiester phosphodiesterase family protein [Thermoguttaceae bacterium]
MHANTRRNFLKFATIAATLSTAKLTESLAEDATVAEVAKAVEASIMRPIPPKPVAAPIVAHRGFSAIAPENTQASAREAIAVGANGCECDVRPTSDGVLILMHDGNLKRCAELDAVPETVAYERYQTLDAGSWKDAKYRGEKVPTLEAWLETLRPTECAPVVEIKSNGIEEKTVEAIRQAGLLERSAVIAFSRDVAKKVRTLEPKLTVAWLYGDKFEGTAAELADRMIAVLDDCNTNLIDIAHGLVSKEFVQIMHERGYYVWCWTVDDPARMEELLRWGVDSITTNRPDLLVEVTARTVHAQ